MSTYKLMIITTMTMTMMMMMMMMMMSSQWSELHGIKLRTKSTYKP